MSSSPPDFPPQAHALPADVASALTAAGSRLGIFRGQALWYADVSSTNDVAQRYADHGAPEGRVVIADHQTAGRGRFGRAWASPAGAGLYVSVVLRPPQAVAPLLTIAAGAALADGLLASTGLAVILKWPNDIWVGTHKLAGILAEAGSNARGIDQVVVGFGINVSKAAYPPDVAARATSLEEELGRSIDRALVLAECLAGIATRYSQLQQGQRALVLDAWRAAAQALLRRTVEWKQGSRSRRGVAVDVDDTGALIVETPEGSERIISGEVRWT